MRWPRGVGGCVPPGAEEQTAAYSNSRGLGRQAGGIHQCVVSFSQEERVFSVGHIQTVSFFTTNYGGDGKERKRRKRGRERGFYF